VSVLAGCYRLINHFAFVTSDSSLVFPLRIFKVSVPKVYHDDYHTAAHDIHFADYKMSGGTSLLQYLSENRGSPQLRTLVLTRVATEMARLHVKFPGLSLVRSQLSDIYVQEDHSVTDYKNDPAFIKSVAFTRVFEAQDILAREAAGISSIAGKRNFYETEVANIDGFLAELRSSENNKGKKVTVCSDREVVVFKQAYSLSLGY